MKKTVTFSIAPEAVETLRRLRDEYELSAAKIIERALRHIQRPGVARRLLGVPRGIDKGSVK